MFDTFFMKLFTKHINCANTIKLNYKRAEVMGLGGRKIQVAPGANIRTKPENIGTECFIGLYTYVNGNVIIEDHVWIGPYCSITAGHHKFDPKTGWFSTRTNEEQDETIRIGEGTWLATGVTVTAGITIGKVNLVCANAVITKDTPDYAIMAGTPAKQIGYIDPVSGEYVWEKKDECK